MSESNLARYKKALSEGGDIAGPFRDEFGDKSRAALSFAKASMDINSEQLATMRKAVPYVFASGVVLGVILAGALLGACAALIVVAG